MTDTEVVILEINCLLCSSKLFYLIFVMRNFTFALLAAAVVAIPGQAEETGLYQQIDQGVCVGVSPNGRYLIGVDTGNSYSSYVLDRESWSYDWFTDASANPTCGRVRGINDNGSAVGDMYDDDFVLDQTDASFDGVGYTNVSLHTAFVYQNGVKTKLDHANANWSGDPNTSHENPNYYAAREDGSYALAINNEETLILGFLNYYGNHYPCYWEWDEEAGEWAAGKLFPSGPIQMCTSSYFRYDYTPDATRAIFHPYGFSNPYQVYTVGESTYALEMDNVNETHEAAISPNGQYIAFSTADCSDYPGSWCIGIYDTATGGTEVLPLPSNIDQQCSVISVTNNKKIYFYSQVRGTTWQFWVCDFEQQSFADIDAYIESYGVEFEGLPSSSLLYSVPTRVSSDGRVVVGGVNSGAKIISSFVIQLPESESIMPVSPDDATLFHTGPYNACVTWSPVEMAGDLQIDYYIVTVDGTSYQAEATAGDNGLVRFDFDLIADGRPHTVDVQSVILYNGKEYKSAKAERTIQMSPRTDLFFFDNVDSNATYTDAGMPVYLGDDWVVCTSNGYLRTFECTSTSGTNYSLVFDALAMGNSFQAYDCTMTSRFLDGGESDNILLTFSYSKGGGIQGWDADEGCYFAVEYATDGENWTEVFRRGAMEMQFNMFSHEVIDISELSGEAFQIRFRVHSSEGTTFDTLIDYMGVIDGNALVEAPAGLRATSVTPEAVSLAWKNSTDEYEVGYSDWRWSASWYSHVGTDAPTMIAAIDLPAEKLAPYVGMYINSITTNIYDSLEPWTSAQGLVYKVNGDELEAVAEGNFATDYFGQNVEGELFPYPTYMQFDAPVLIEAGVTYRVGVRIYDYQEGATPLYYSAQNSDDCIWGVTDLFSEDDGETWTSLGEYWYNYITYDEFTGSYTQPYQETSYVTWPIRVGITEEESYEERDHDLELYAFDIYRNGEKINTDRLISFTEQHYADLNPLSETASYQVRAYYRDGRVSECSTPLQVSPAGIAAIGKDNQECIVKVSDGLVSIAGTFVSASLYNMAGQQVLTTAQPQFSVAGMAAGVYVLRIDNVAYKIIVR